MASVLVRRNPLISPNLAQVSKMSLKSMSAGRQGNNRTRLIFSYSRVSKWKCFYVLFNFWVDFTFGVGGAVFNGPAVTVSGCTVCECHRDSMGSAFIASYWERIGIVNFFYYVTVLH